MHIIRRVASALEASCLGYRARLPLLLPTVFWPLCVFGGSLFLHIVNRKSIIALKMLV